MSATLNPKAPRYRIPAWPALESALTSLADAIDAKKIPKIVNGKGILIAQNKDTVTISAQTSTGEVAARLPWQPLIYPVKDVDGVITGYEVAIYYGTLNGFMPGNQLTAGALTRFTVPDGMTYWTLDANTNGKSVSTLTLASSATAPTQETATTPAAPLAFKSLLFVTYRNGTTSCTAHHVRKAHLLANPKLSINIPKSSWGVGELSYDPYYVWEVLDA